MKRFGTRAAWLGWVVAGVLALSAGGVAFAASNNSGNDPGATRNLLFAQAGGKQPNGQAGNTTGDAAGKRAAKGFPGRRGLLGGGVGGGRLLHSETAVQTKDGVKTFVVARGDVTALSTSSITITSSDKVATTFAINSDTRYGFQNFKQPQAQLRTGQTATAIGTKSGSNATATRIITAGS